MCKLKKKIEWIAAQYNEGKCSTTQWCAVQCSARHCKWSGGRIGESWKVVALYTVHYSVHCTLLITLYTLHVTLLTTLYTALYTVHCSVHTVVSRLHYFLGFFSKWKMYNKVGRLTWVTITFFSTQTYWE